MRLRKIAAVSTLALAAAGITATAPAATAATGALVYNCQVPLLGMLPGQSAAQQFETTLDTNYAPVVAVGAKGVLTVKVKVPASLSGMLGTGTLSGALKGDLTVSGQKISYTATFPKSTKPATGDMYVTATGNVVLPAGGPIIAGDYSATLQADVGLPNPVAVEATCKAPAAGAKTVDAVKVKSKIKVKASSKAGKGTAKVTVKGAKGGKVTVQVLKGKKTVKKAKGAVKKGVANVKLKGIKKGKYTLKVSYSGDSTAVAATGKGKLTAK